MHFCALVISNGNNHSLILGILECSGDSRSEYLPAVRTRKSLTHGTAFVSLKQATPASQTFTLFHQPARGAFPVSTRSDAKCLSAIRHPHTLQLRPCLTQCFSLCFLFSSYVSGSLSFFHLRCYANN